MGILLGFRGLPAERAHVLFGGFRICPVYREVLGVAGLLPARKDPFCFSPNLFRAVTLIERFFNNTK